ncbi:hypothetical protein ACFE04_009934 [Oxalis oulophora]
MFRVRHQFVYSIWKNQTFSFGLYAARSTLNFKIIEERKIEQKKEAEIPAAVEEVNREEVSAQNSDKAARVKRKSVDFPPLSTPRLSKRLKPNEPSSNGQIQSLPIMDVPPDFATESGLVYCKTRLH